jgi:hypothetical protein
MEPYKINGAGGSVDKLGVITAEEVWEVDTQRECLKHTPDHELGIPISHRQWREQPHGKWHVTFTFEGVDNISEAQGREEYEIDGSTSEDPIESHHFIDTLMLRYTHEIRDGRIIWAIKMTDSSGKEVRSPMAGYEGYLNPGLIWTQHQLHSELPSDLLEALGAIDDPPGEPPPLPNPRADLPARNWLQIRVIARKRGNIWQVSKSWQASGSGGWNVDVYERA